MGSGGPGPQLLLVATPGRLEDHLYNTPGFRARFDDLRTFVLDEADQMLDMGFRPTITKILAALPPPSLLSATAAMTRVVIFCFGAPGCFAILTAATLAPSERGAFSMLIAGKCDS